MKKYLLLLLIFIGGISPAAKALNNSTRDFIVTVGGDVNFARSDENPDITGFLRYGKEVSFEEQTRHIVPLLAGADVNFCNFESVITDLNDLQAEEKQFNFRTHPHGLEFLADAGFNLFSMANNHAYDYGVQGIEQTVQHAKEVRLRYNMAFSGIGSNYEESLTPQVLVINGVRIGFIAFGNGPAQFFPTKTEAGVNSYNSDNHLKVALRRLKNLNVDLRFVSIHTGTEKVVELESHQEDRFKWILQEGQVDLILAHHPHVVKPVQIINGHLIFYSLGNYFLAGAMDMTRSGIGTDYGLFAKIQFHLSSLTGKYEISTVEAVPLTNTNYSPRPMVGETARQRIEFLNNLSYSQVGAEAAEFTFNPASSTGVWKKN
jgi:poly-gamma-glutamate capsule biosynthesis protein CapA/YwtB (metallophosphatase superfamily)